jgi:hypothetical protein
MAGDSRQSAEIGAETGPNGAFTSRRSLLIAGDFPTILGEFAIFLQQTPPGFAMLRYLQPGG